MQRRLGLKKEESGRERERDKERETDRRGKRKGGSESLEEKEEGIELERASEGGGWG